MSATRISSAGEIRDCLSAIGKHVISFSGFGELGYEEEDVVERVARDILLPWRSHEILVNSGTLLRSGGQDGIAAVYAVARQLGIETTGIHPSIALDFSETHHPSPFCDRVFFVEDRTWGGFDGPGRLSPTLQVVLDVSDELVVIGGGKHAADELEAFMAGGKRVRYFAAEMNRHATTEWCRRSGASITDYRGAAHATWLSLGQSGDH